MKAIYSYRKLDGREQFQRVRFENGSDRKTIVYRFDCHSRIRGGCIWRDHNGEHWHWEKAPGADVLLYRLPEVLAGIAERRTIYWAEGEKDADALAAAGVVSTSHHQGAEVGPTFGQAQWLVGARRIVLVMDRDSAGAFDVWRRHQRLAAVGVRPARISIVRGYGPIDRISDAYDHLTAGFIVDQFVPVSKSKVEAQANRHRAERKGRARQAYRPGPRWDGA
jgi:hypothetical protein